MKKLLVVILFMLPFLTVEVNAEESKTPLDEVTIEEDESYKDLTDDEIARMDYEIAMKAYYKERESLFNTEKTSFGVKGPIGPEEGYFDLYTSDHFPGGGIYWADKKSGIYELVKDELLSMLGIVTKKVSTVIIAVVTLYNDIEIDKTENVTGELGYSYTYTAKEGLIFTNGQWKSYVECHKRYTWQHYRGQFVGDDAFVRQQQLDFIHSEGYLPIDTKPSTHYHDDSWISAKAREGYINGTYILELVSKW